MRLWELGTGGIITREKTSCFKKGIKAKSLWLRSLSERVYFLKSASSLSTHAAVPLYAPSTLRATTSTFIKILTQKRTCEYYYFYKQNHLNFCCIECNVLILKRLAPCSELLKVLQHTFFLWGFMSLDSFPASQQSYVSKEWLSFFQYI